MDQQKKELVDKLKGANNVLVTVSSNPSVDQLAACIGLTLLLNKLKKHATAVFSGEVPSTIEFLKPEDTLERNTDSLRDFIISLDKSKADKLRYKVEDRVVKIFITPYRTSISQDDLEFSQGDFNVDVVLCLGVQQQQDLDQAITAHGRILHDAVVASISTTTGGELGTVNWIDPGASSLSELATSLADSLGKDLVDAQIATALLTGIVAETARFSNEKTSPETMRLSAELMTAGANQQLVANELQQLHPAPAEGQPEATPPEAPKAGDGTLEINHPEGSDEPDEPSEPPAPSEPTPPNDQPPAGLGEGGGDAPDTPPAQPGSSEQPASRIILQPPSLGGTLTANSTPEGLDPSTDPLGVPLTADTPMLNHDGGGSAAQQAPQPAPVEPPAAGPLPANPVTEELPALDLPTPTPGPTDAQIHVDPDGNLQLADQQPPAAPPQPASSVSAGTLNDLEKSLDSPHQDTPDEESARNAVLDALNSATPTSLEPKADVGASGYLDVQNLPDDADATQDTDMSSPAPSQSEPAPMNDSPADQPLSMPLPPPPSFSAPGADTVVPAPSEANPPEPQAPPVPPPMTELPPFRPPA